MSTSSTMLALNENRLCISGLGARRFIDHFPGISRVKPVTYFGEPYPLTCERLGITFEQAVQWYERIYSAYKHYWGEPEGRLHCYEPRPPIGSQGESAHIAASVVPSLPQRLIAGDQIRIGLELSPIEHLRRVQACSPAKGRLQVADQAPSKEHPQFLQYERETLDDRQYRLADAAVRVDAKDRIWLSMLEVNALRLPESKAIRAAWVAGASVPEVPKTTIVDPWEALSFSVSAAHSARLAGEVGSAVDRPTLEGMIKAGASRACLIERVAPILDALPAGTRVEHSLGRIQFAVDSGAVGVLLELAYRNKLLPTYALRGWTMPWKREKGAFDVLFEMLMTGQTNALADTDVRSLVKGGVRGRA